MAFKKVPNDAIPMKAGVVRLTPLDPSGKKLRDQAVTTRRDFIVSTQHTSSRTSETLPNGNGQDGEYPTEEIHNLAVSTNVYDHVFHSTVAGLQNVTSPRPVMYDTTIVPSASDATFTFEDEAMYPVASEDDEKIHFEIRDTYGNLLKETQSSPATDDYKYDSSMHKLTFPEAYKGVTLSCVYYIAGTDGVAYQADPIIKNRQYMIEVMGEVQSATTAEPMRYYACITRGVVSGDIPDITTQKSITNTITYNFKSAPVPVGVTPFYDSFTPIKAGGAAAAAASVMSADKNKAKV